MPTIRINRRQGLVTGAAATSLLLLAFSRANSRPRISHGLQSGDVGHDGAMIWARADRPSLMNVEVATTESFGTPAACRRWRSPTAAHHDSPDRASFQDFEPSGSSSRARCTPAPSGRTTWT